MLSFVFSTAVTHYSLRHLYDKDLGENSRMLALRIYDAISSELTQPVMVAETMASNEFLKERLAAETDSRAFRDSMEKYLRSVHVNMEYESVFVISEKSKRYYSFMGSDKIIDAKGSNQWYKKFLDSGQRYELSVDKDSMWADKWTVFVNAALLDEEKNRLGICGVGIQMDRLQRMFRKYEEEFHVKVNLVDKTGKVFVDSMRLEQIYLAAWREMDASDNSFRWEPYGVNGHRIIKRIDPLNWYLVVQSYGGEDSSELDRLIWLCIGANVLLFLIIVLSGRAIISHGSTITQESLRDKMTGLRNRYAYEERIAKLMLSNNNLPEKLVLIVLDLNGLKTANDECGHAAGDELILAAADLMHTAFRPIGKCYRTGGDEFVVIAEAETEEVRQLIKEFKAEVAAWRGELMQELSVSCGMAALSENTDKSFGELMQLADEAMYRDKAAYYATSGRDRRHN